MKKLLVICLALALFASMGCGDKSQNDEKSTTTQAGAARSVSLTDPVDGSKIENFEEAKYSWVHNRVEYRFNSEKRRVDRSNYRRFSFSRWRNY